MPITDPTDLADLAAWFDPDQIDVSGTHFLSGVQYVDAWDDVAGLVDDWASAGATEPFVEPDVKLGNSMVRFSGAEYMVPAAAWSLPVPYSFWVVIGADSTAGMTFLSEADGTPQFSVAATTKAITAFDGGVNLTSSGVPIGTLATPKIVGFVIDSVTRTVRINGAQVFSSASGSPEAAFDPGTLGRYGPSASFWFNGHIGEMVFCDAALSGTDLDDLEFYLYNRWVKPLLDGDTDGPFFSAAPIRPDALALGPPTIGGPPWSSPAVLSLTSSALGDAFDTAQVIGGPLVLEGHMQMQTNVPWAVPAGLTAKTWTAERFTHPVDPTGWDGGPTYD